MNEEERERERERTKCVFDIHYREGKDGTGQVKRGFPSRRLCRRHCKGRSDAPSPDVPPELGPRASGLDTLGNPLPRPVDSSTGAGRGRSEGEWEDE